MHLNHSKTIPLPHLWKNCLLWKWFLVQESLGTTALQCCISFFLYSEVNQPFVHIYPFSLGLSSHHSPIPPISVIIKHQAGLPTLYSNFSLAICILHVVAVKNAPAMQESVTGNEGLIPGSWGFPLRGHCNPLQSPYLNNPMDRKPGGLQSLGSQRIRHN